MDDSGRMYAAPSLKEYLERDAGRKLDVKPLDKAPTGALEIKDPKVAETLARMNRKGRRIFMKARRRGKSEVDAMCEAEGSYDERQGG